tara:strand:- start:2266 stop:2478 length:213 start_codon:yes stop_codon:yes gene_type:complete
MKKLIKKFKAWLACLVRANEVWIVYTISPESNVSIIIATYQMEDAIECMNMYNTYNTNKEAAWLTKQEVY